MVESANYAKKKEKKDMLFYEKIFKLVIGKDFKFYGTLNTLDYLLLQVYTFRSFWKFCAPCVF